MKILIGRLARCILLLEEHDFVVVCKSGRNHNDTDKLSRCPLPDKEQVYSALTEQVIALSVESVALAQLANPWTHPIIQHLDGRQPSESQRFVRNTQPFRLIGGILYRHNTLLMAPDGFSLFRLNAEGKSCVPRMTNG